MIGVVKWVGGLGCFGMILDWFGVLSGWFHWFGGKVVVVRHDRGSRDLGVGGSPPPPPLDRNETFWACLGDVPEIPLFGSRDCLP